ncbi:MAG: DNA gyrase C-terminal beta-propeller domain-containing protein, partial [Oscillospiraceae bacterium]|nr:DNA gyrase C-terminal beta-propeller domain-containing protein [Oscillospiraceae bacterium]
ARLTDGAQEIVLVTRKGMSIRSSEDDVRNTGRNTMGVRGIRLGIGDWVVGMVPIVDGMDLLVVSERGFGKRTQLSEYRVQTRGGKGLMTYRIAEKTGPLVRVSLVDDMKDLLLINDNGIVIRLGVSEIPVLSRVTQGVTLMRTRDCKIVDVAVVDHEEEEDWDGTVQEEGVILEEETGVDISEDSEPGHILEQEAVGDETEKDQPDED